MSALLLRLFESEHFSIHLAVAYLRNYADSIGVTSYLVRRLVEFPDSELEFYWPQLCHLLVTRPTESVALENLILDRCDTSIHLAMLTLWYLQASLTDIQKTPTSVSFAICRRALNRIQHVIFSDHLPSINGLSTAQTLGLQDVARIQANVNPAFVGIGMVALSAALPALSLRMGPVAIEQGRRVIEEDVRGAPATDDAEARESASSEEEGEPVKVAPASSFQPRTVNGVSKRTAEKSREPSYVPGRPLPPSEEPTNLAAPSRQPSSMSPRPRNTMPTSQSASHLPPGRRKPGPGSPLAQRTMQPSRPSPRQSVGTGEIPASARFPAAEKSNSSLHVAQAHSASVPILPLSAASRSNASLNTSSLDYLTLSQSLPKPLLVKLLRSYACRAQLDLLTSLQDISTRLILVPKPARLSALRAELTVLNHSLPRGCCLGIGCPGEGRHHRVIRISPSEAVVLNSADRAPFLLQVEILEADLDFEPARRQNAEDVRKVLDEREAAIARQSYRSSHPLPKRRAVEPTAGAKLATAVTDGFSNAMRAVGIDASSDGGEIRPSPGRRRAHERSVSDTRTIESSCDSESTLPSPPPSRPHSIARPAPTSPSPPAAASNEEVDLVEQLYGDTQMHDLVSPVTDEPYSPKPIKNRIVDEAAWQRGDRRPGLLSPEMPRTPLASSGASTPDARGGMTLDQYAERMRMAAVMLAQLSASQQPSIGITGTATELVGAGVGLGAGLVGAALGRLPFARASGSTTPQAGQASSGVMAKIDTSTAASAGAELTSPRQRILSQTDATAIRERIMREMMDLETERMERMRLDSRARTGGWTTSSSYSPAMSLGNVGRQQDGGDEDVNVVKRAVNKDDPSGAVLRESWVDKRARIRAASPYGHLAAWDLLSVIVKTGADLRQEQLAIQLIREFGRIWSDAGCPHWVRYFRILVTSDSTGLMETITDAVSVHSLKKEAYAVSQPAITSGAGEAQQPFVTYTLYDHFVETYGDPSTSTFRKAQDCFMRSLASYSVICYLLQIKDRHNGNILIDRDGHCIHIDFGFLLSNSPGSLGFEMAPFKLPQDYIDILGGITSEKFADFRSLVKRLFWEARRQAERVIMIVELMQKDSNLPCFSSGEQTAQLLRERFQLSSTRAQCDEYVDRLIDSSALSVFTRLYDAFQAYSQGIL